MLSVWVDCRFFLFFITLKPGDVLPLLYYSQASYLLLSSLSFITLKPGDV